MQGHNPLVVETDLIGIASNTTVPHIAERDIVEHNEDRDKKGQEAFDLVFTDRHLKATAKMSIWDPLKKLSLNHLPTGKRKSATSSKTKLWTV